MPTYKPEDYPVGAKFTRASRFSFYDDPLDKYARSTYGDRKGVDEGVLADPKLDPVNRSPALGGALFGPSYQPYVYVRWTKLNGTAVRSDNHYGSCRANTVRVTEKPPTPEEIRKQAEALLDQAGYTLIAIDKVANATKLSFNEGVLRLAGIHGKEVEFRYTKTDTAPVEQRRLLVESVEAHGDVILVGGSDPDRGGYRNFRLDRIKGEVRFA
jgi:hypothetical protein